MFGVDKIVGRVRGLVPGRYAENRDDEQFHLESNGAQIIVQGLPKLVDLVRQGESWQLLTAAFTGLAVVPTTVAGARIWNGEPSNGKVYAIDSVAVFRPIIDVTTDDSFCVWAQNVRAPVVTAVPTDSGVAKTSLSGKANYSGRARHDTGTANSAVTGRWDTIGSSPSTAPAIAGTAWTCVDLWVLGKYIIPPGGAFDIHVTEVTATASGFRAAIRWHEVQIGYLT